MGYGNCFQSIYDHGKNARAVYFLLAVSKFCSLVVFAQSDKVAKVDVRFDVSKMRISVVLRSSSLFIILVFSKCIFRPTICFNKLDHHSF